MLLETKQVNITQLFDEEILSLVKIKIVELRSKFIELWDKEPITTQFPDLLALVEPTNQINSLAQGKRIIVSNQEIKEFASRNLENLLRYALFFKEIISKPLKAYGFNYTFFIKFEDEEIVKVKDRMTILLNLENLGVNVANFIGGGFNFSYKKDDIRFQLIANPLYEENLTKIIGFEIQTNTHYFSDEIKQLTELMAIFKNNHEELKEHIKKIFLNL